MVVVFADHELFGLLLQFYLTLLCIFQNEGSITNRVGRDPEYTVDKENNSEIFLFIVFSFDAF